MNESETMKNYVEKGFSHPESWQTPEAGGLGALSQLLVRRCY